MYSKETMKARYTDLAKQCAKITAKADPLRAKRDALLAEYQPRELALNDQIAKAEDGLFDVRQEMGLIAKALGHETPAV